MAIQTYGQARVRHALVLLTLCALMGGGSSRLLGQAAGDFNGDGYEDLAIGVPHEAAGAIAEAGVVSVIYGGSSGLQAFTPDDQAWHQNSPGVPDVNEPADHFGGSVAAGDFNGDGYDDLAIGVPAEDIGTIVDAGAVIILHGSSAGLQSSGSGGPAAQQWWQSATGIGGASEAFDYFGSSLATADFDGDGYDDLAIGVPAEAVGTIVGAGAVNTLMCSALGETSGGSHFCTQAGIGVLETGDEFGWSLAGADFDDDGYDDLAIGVPFENVGTIMDAGAVNILYGADIGLTASGAQEFHQNTVSVSGTSEAFDNLGYALACGQFNSDAPNAYADLAIGAPGEAIGTLSAAGSVNVLYGSSTGLQAGATGGVNDQLWFQDVADVDGTSEAYDKFGSSLCTGDLTGDGADDLAIGVPLEDIGTIADAGAVNVLFGSGLGLQVGSFGLGDQLWDQTFLETVEAGDGFGADVFAGDFNGDTILDLAIGVPCEAIGTIAHAGAVNVLPGTTSGLTVLGSQFWSQNSASVKDASEAHDHFGWGHCIDLGLIAGGDEIKRSALANDEEVSELVSDEKESIKNFSVVADVLEESYPNPFNPVTTIGFTIHEAGPVRLSVYNVLGELVATLVDNPVHSAGRFSAQFNASNLASGVYISRLETREMVETKRMLLVK